MYMCATFFSLQGKARFISNLYDRDAESYFFKPELLESLRDGTAAVLVNLGERQIAKDIKLWKEFSASRGATKYWVSLA